ncbi:hypothetical protein HGG75_25230 [Ochrobactrum pseudogrignonense]|nr:hypothetical protein [Brucella pseudogrignonensis]
MNVARYEGGSDANMNITLKAGSEASGDIVDTDQKGSGQTHVNVEENAKFNGKISGIQDLKTESGTQMSFAEGTSIGGNIVATGSTYSFHSTGALIAGNVELYSGSSTGGGTTDTPITVSGMFLSIKPLYGRQLGYRWRFDCSRHTSPGQFDRNCHRWWRCDIRC